MVSKYSTMVCSISYLLSCQTPSEFCSPTIQFFLCLWLTVAWKNFVFLSPHFSHSALDLWFHIIFSLTWISLISLLTLLISSVFPCKLSHNSSYWIFFFSASYWHYRTQSNSISTVVPGIFEVYPLYHPLTPSAPDPMPLSLFLYTFHPLYTLLQKRNVSPPVLWAMWILLNSLQCLVCTI